MRKKTILAALTIVMMLFTIMPATAVAAQKETSSEIYVEYLEEVYAYYIKDRSKYCDEVWAEIQQTYREGRACYVQIDSFEEWYETDDYETALAGLGKLTWVKSYDDLPEVKSRYLKEINTEYKRHNKADYSDYSWDLIQDGLYIGRNMINAAETFKDAAMGYSEAMTGMEWATTKEELKEYKEMYIAQLSQIVNLCLDPSDYSEPVWNEILAVFEVAKDAINAAELEYEIENLYEEYLEKICDLSGLEYPVSYELIYETIEAIMQPAYDFYDEMDETEYTWERIDEADEIIWDLEDAIYEAVNRTAAENELAKAMKKLEALPHRDYDESICKNYVVKAKAVGTTGTNVKVSWNASNDLDGYIVYRSNSKNGTYKQVKYCYSGKTGSYVDKNLTYGKTYYYKVKGIKYIDYEEEYTKASAVVSGTPKLVAPAVTLKKVNSADVQLSWKKVPGADGYQIYRSNSVNGQFKLVKTIKKGSTVTWKDTSTVKGKTYCYKMRTYDVQKNGKKKFSAYSTIKTIKR